MTGDGGSGSQRASMDRIYRYQRHIYDLTRRWFLLGRTTLVEGLQPTDGGSVLEIGCGTAWNLIRIAGRYPAMRLHGLDISTVMLATARRRIAAKGLSGRIRLAAADATRFDAGALFGETGFNRVVISYALSMIPDWETVLDQAINCLGRNGQLHIVDFGRQAGLPRLARAGLNAWLAKFGVTPRATLEQALRERERRHDMRLFITEVRAGYAVYAVLERRS